MSQAVAGRRQAKKARCVRSCFRVSFEKPASERAWLGRSSKGEQRRHVQWYLITKIPTVFNSFKESQADPASLPPTQVFITFKSSSRRTKSASAPTLILPFLSCMPRTLAGWKVAASSASPVEHWVYFL